MLHVLSSGISLKKSLTLKLSPEGQWINYYLFLHSMYFFSSFHNFDLYCVGAKRVKKPSQEDGRGVEVAYIAYVEPSERELLLERHPRPSAK